MQYIEENTGAESRSAAAWVTHGVYEMQAREEIKQREIRLQALQDVYNGTECPHCGYWTHRGTCLRCGWYWIPRLPDPVVNEAMVLETQNRSQISDEERAHRHQVRLSERTYGVGICLVCGEEFIRGSNGAKVCPPPKDCRRKRMQQISRKWGRENYGLGGKR